MEGETLLEELLKARDKLNLPPDDPMCDFIDEKLFPPDELVEEDSDELAQARRELLPDALSALVTSKGSVRSFPEGISMRQR
jgi:hypothetical protein